MGQGLRIRQPGKAYPTNTDGWYAVIGDLGKGQPHLEVWLDRFSGYPNRRLNACLRSDSAERIEAIAENVPEQWWKWRKVTTSDTVEEKYLVLKRRLRRDEFQRTRAGALRNRPSFSSAFMI